MKNKKAFTLIELLAVLVVLAILALISIPITIRIINQSRENSYKRSIANYAKALENYIALKNIDNSGNDYDLLYNYANDEDFDKSYSGNRVICDFSSTSNTDDNFSTLINGKLILRGCRVNSNDKLYKYENSKVEIQQIYETYKIGKKIQVVGDTSGDYYYVIKNSSKTEDYVVVLKENPLNADEVNLYGGVGTENNHVNLYSHLVGTPTAYRENGYGGIQYYSSPSCGYTGSWSKLGCTTSYDESEIKYVVDAWARAKFTHSELKTVDKYKARLIYFDEVHSLGYSDEPRDLCGSSCPIYYATDEVLSWVYSSQYDYWTMSPYEGSSYRVWRVDGGSLYSDSVDSGVNTLRPVINVYKDKIESGD